MKFFLTENFVKTFPNHTVAFGIVEDTKVDGPNDKTAQILSDIYPEVIKKYEGQNLSELPNSKAYEAFAEKISQDRFGFPYKQIERVLKGKNIGNINNIVNAYMVFELLSNLSFSAYDADQIEGDLIVDIAKPHETITLIGGEEKTIPIGDLVFRDTQGIVYSFCEGYADRTKVSTETINVLFAIDCPSGIDQALIEQNIKDLCAKFNSEEFFLLKSKNPNWN